MRKCLIYFVCFVLAILAAMVQNNDESQVYKNEVATNAFLPIFESVDLNFERTLGKKFALGIAAAVYGDRIDEISLENSYNDLELRTRYELMPFARIYFGGNQRPSHFLEIFGSIRGVD